MCQSKPGVRCGNHANKASKVAYKKYLKVRSKSLEIPQEDSAKLMDFAEENMHYARAMFNCSPYQLAQLSKDSDAYEKNFSLNRLYSNALRTSKYYSSRTPLGIGHKVAYDIKSGTVSKTPEGNYQVVGMKKGQPILWDHKNPYEVHFLKKTGEAKVINLKKKDISDNKKSALLSKEIGYSRKPDVRVVMWMIYSGRIS